VAAERIDVEQDFYRRGRKSARKFTRGPKPGRALREIGLEPQVDDGGKPTSEGIVEMLSGLDLTGHRIGLQLYPDKDHSTLIGAITAQGAEVDIVLPYVYDGAGPPCQHRHRGRREDGAGRIDAIALTQCSGAGSPSHRRRAGNTGAKRVYARGLAPHTTIASVGACGCRTNSNPTACPPTSSPANDAYFMKPLISAMAAALGKSLRRAPTIIAGDAKPSGT